MSRPGSTATNESPSDALQRAIDFEQAIAGVAASLLRVPVDGIDDPIRKALETLGEQLGADRASVLQNVIERAMILSDGSVLRIEEALGSDSGDKGPAERRRSGESLRDAERTHIVDVLERCQWTIEGRGRAADRLGLNPSTLRNRMRKLGIKRPAR